MSALRLRNVVILLRYPLGRHICYATRRKNYIKLKKEEAKSKIDAHPNVLQIAIDCGNDQYFSMSPKNRRSLANQISQAHSSNLKYRQPCKLHLVGVAAGGDVEASLLEHCEVFSSSKSLMEVTSKPLLDVFPADQVVYLAPTSSAVLTEVSSSNVYVIGGLVDCSVEKGVSEGVAHDLAVRSARLPIKEHMKPSGIKSVGNLDLAINQVFEILMEVWLGATWTESLWTHLPRRKQWVPISSELIPELNTSSLTSPPSPSLSFGHLLSE